MAPIILICFIFLTFSCQSEKQKNVDYTQRVQALETIEQKKMFLDSINFQFQYLRKESDSAIMLYGLNSKKHNQKKKEFKEFTKIQFQKVDAFLNTYGYPSIMEVGGPAVYAPYLITSNMDDLKSKEKNFVYFYDAYMFGNLSDGLFYSYVADLYHLKTNKSHLYDPNQQIDDQIEFILAELDYN